MAKKFDTGKYRFSLLPQDSLIDVAKVGTMGAQKYGDDNWKMGNGLEWRRLLDAHYRHLHAFVEGESTDSESQLPHLAHACWNLLALLHYQKNNIGVDNIHKEEKKDK